MQSFTIGVDYGSDSVRAVIVNTQTGEIVGTQVFMYPRWKKGLYCDPSKSQFRQHPLDYIEGLETTIVQALKQAPAGTASNVVGITVDTTGSTPCAVSNNGTPIALLPGEEENINGMFILWKDHTALDEAALINEKAHNWGGLDVTKYVGGIYSSEWFWAKILHVLQADASMRNKAYSWVEHCDWVTAILVGDTNPLTLYRSRCAAGHKALWHPDWGGLPPQEFLTSVSPLFEGIRNRLYQNTYTAGVSAGTLCPEWAQKLGLSTQVTIGVGAFDAHLGAVGAGIKPYYLCKVMGTSTCDMLLAPNAEIGSRLVAGICGQVDGSIIPNMLGMEAGQSAFGDVYAWFKRLLLNPINDIMQQNGLLDDSLRMSLSTALDEAILPYLSQQASTLAPNEHDVLALDWLNGRRTPDADQSVAAALTGLRLGTDAVQVFKALVEATSFGARAIVERFQSEGVRIEGVIGLGGVSKKSPYIMQTMADVLQMPIQIAAAEQACALGSAMAAAVAAGVYPDFNAAISKMGSGIEKTYIPNKALESVYNNRYKQYKKLGAAI